MKLTAKELQTGLVELKLADRLRSNYYRQWAESEYEAGPDGEIRPPSTWRLLFVKLRLLDDVMAELRKLANSEGVDNGKSGT